MPEVVMVSRMLLWHSRKNSTGTAMIMNVTAAAAPAQAAVLDGLDDLIGGHPRQHTAQCLVAIHGYVFINILGVDDTAVAQGHAVLLFVEFGVV